MLLPNDTTNYITNLLKKLVDKAASNTSINTKQSHIINDQKYISCKQSIDRLEFLQI